MQGMIAFYFGELVQAREFFESGFALYEPQQHRSLVFVYGLDAGVVTLSFLAWISWLSGEADQARQRINHAVTLARDLVHPFSH